MKQTLLSLLSASLLLAACGAVEAPHDPDEATGLDYDGEPIADEHEIAGRAEHDDVPRDGDDGDDSDLPEDDDVAEDDDGDDSPADEPAYDVLPLLVDGAKLSTSSLALSRLSLTPGITAQTREDVRDLVRGDGHARDVSEVRVVTTTSDPVLLTIEMPEPTGSYVRTIGTDGGVVTQTKTGSIQCEAFGYALDKPECNTAVPGAYERSANGQLAARWSIRMIDDQTEAPVECTQEPRRAVCSLPGRAFTAYRIEVGVTALADVYADEGELGFPFDAYNQWGSQWLGRIVMTPRCVRMVADGFHKYCEQWDIYGRGRGIDRASIAVQPFALAISAGGASTTVQMPAASWDTGNQDLPGPTY